MNAAEEEAQANKLAVGILKDAVHKAIMHLIDYGSIEVGTPQSTALIAALKVVGWPK